jgi:hypothetical protein
MARIVAIALIALVAASLVADSSAGKCLDKSTPQSMFAIASRQQPLCSNESKLLIRNICFACNAYV